MKEISAGDLKKLLDQGERPIILDVRQPEEFAEASIEGAVLIPLGELESRIHELDPLRSMIINCRSGARSAKACAILEAHGFKDVTNLIGGIIAWKRVS